MGENVTKGRDNEGPTITEYTIYGRDDEVIYLLGQQLGFATSHRDTHDHPVSYDDNKQLTSFAPPGDRCSACRWFEVRIFAVKCELTSNNEPIDRRARYLVLTSGMSQVPGEVEMRRASWTDSSYEVLELLTQRRGDRPMLPAPSARVLSQAAMWDVDIRNAYLDRVVA
jgi:hypothetical protein